MIEQKNSSSRHPRSVSQLRTHSPWLWFGYAQTDGLESFREHERYSAWWHAHRQLKGLDATYALQCKRFHVQIVASVLFALALFVFLSTRNPLLVTLLLSTLPPGSIALLFFVREQQRRNDWIGKRFSAGRSRGN